MVESASTIETSAKAPALLTAALSLFVVTAISGISYALFLRPLYQKYLQLDKSVNAQSVLLTGMNLKKSNPAAFSQMLNSYHKEIDEIDRQLPTIDKASEFISQAVTKASTFGIHFQSVEQANIQNEAEYSVLPTHMILMGRYVDLLNWIYWLSHSQVAIQIDKIEFTVFSESESENVLAAEINFNVYARSS